MRLDGVAFGAVMAYRIAARRRHQFEKGGLTRGIEKYSEVWYVGESWIQISGYTVCLSNITEKNRQLLGTSSLVLVGVCVVRLSLAVSVSTAKQGV